MRYWILAVLLFACTAAAAQDEEILKAAIFLSGAATEEDLDPSFVEMLEARRGRKVHINGNNLRASAFLSDYQVAVIRDYREKNGDILSFEELSLLEGFSAAAVEALRPFLSLYSSNSPGALDSTIFQADAYLRSTLKTVGGKAKFSGKIMSGGLAARTSERFRKWDGSFYCDAQLRNHRIVAGNYKLRFGEGLGLWSGFSMENLSTVDAFIKRTQGISPVWSFNPSGVQRGIAYEYSSVKWRASAFASFDKTIGARAQYLGRHFQAGLTTSTLASSPLMISADAKLNLGGLLWSAEVAWRNGGFAGKSAIKMPLGEYFRLAVQGRIVPCKYSGKKYGEYAIAAGTDFSSRKVQASLTVDAAFLPIPQTEPGRFQLRAYGKAVWKISESLSVEGRITERYRNYELPRTAIRAHLSYVKGKWNGNLRTEMVLCEKAGFLAYSELGYKGSQFTAWLRTSGFWAPCWNDRIYIYERDAPGSFSVPAYYGKGVNISIVGMWKHQFRHIGIKAYARAAYTFKNGCVPAPVLNLQICARY